jgi:NAD(P)-dependent dehydrogenase (short-subunit alcohol dehydrogenase family)
VAFKDNLYASSSVDVVSANAMITLRWKPVAVGLGTTTGLLLLKRYFGGAVCKSKARIDGKVVVITGANTGIGKETALDLAKRGGKVYLACRSLEKARQAVDDIRRSASIDSERLLAMHLDLSSLDSVRSFVKDFHQKEKQLDILINNAGVAWISSYTETADGFESTFGVNHLGPFLLTHLLMDLLMANSGSRIVNVASRAHLRAFFSIDTVLSQQHYDRFRAYSNSKLANILFTREMARRLGREAPVTVYCLHPGVVYTELGRNAFVNRPVLRQIALAVIWLFLKNPQQGAQTTIFCAVDEKVASETGKYYRL